MNFSAVCDMCWTKHNMKSSSLSFSWETKDTENQYSDSGIPCINHFIGNQDKNGLVRLVIMQQILIFTA